MFTWSCRQGSSCKGRRAATVTLLAAELVKPLDFPLRSRSPTCHSRCYQGLKFTWVRILSRWSSKEWLPVPLQMEEFLVYLPMRLYWTFFEEESSEVASRRGWHPNPKIRQSFRLL